MRRLAAWVFAFAVILAAALPAAAATGATQVKNQTLVSADGSSQVYLDITLHLEQAVGSLSFCVPANAYDVSLNGVSARTWKAGEALGVDLSGVLGGMTGDFNLILRYSLPNCVDEDEAGRLTLRLPILSGFAYPIEALHCELRLPGQISAQPRFRSGYYQESIESDITAKIEGDTVIFDTSRLKDHETLAMQLDVTAELFPNGAARKTQLRIGEWGMPVCAALAALYFLLFMRCLPQRRVRQVTPPAELTAGELGCALTGQGADLSLMALSWAQLGYLLIYLDDNGRVVLHKRMEMGNERSEFEMRCFRLLFGRGGSIDATGQTYAGIAARVAAMPRARGWLRKSSGNPKLLRLLAALIGLFGGLSVSMAVAGDAWLAIVLHVALCALGAVSAWHIQSGAYSLFLSAPRKRRNSLICSGAWLLAGLLSKTLTVALTVVALEWLFGAAAAYGGRRTALGKQAMAQVLGLRRHLRTVSAEQLRQIVRSDPDYFFTLVPYAIALGVGKRFAKRFGAARLSGCPYLTTGMDAHMTASEWTKQIASTVAAMDELRAAMPYEQFLSFGAAVTRRPGRTQSRSRRSGARQDRTRRHSVRR